MQAAPGHVATVRVLSVQGASSPASADCLLRGFAKAIDDKARLLGHWGTTPGLNFIYAHMNPAIRRDEFNMIYLADPGHGSPAMVAKMYLEDS